MKKLNAVFPSVDLVDVGNSETLTCEIFIWFWGLEELHSLIDIYYLQHLT